LKKFFLLTVLEGVSGRGNKKKIVPPFLGGGGEEGIVMPLANLCWVSCD